MANVISLTEHRQEIWSDKHSKRIIIIFVYIIILITTDYMILSFTNKIKQDIIQTSQELDKTINNLTFISSKIEVAKTNLSKTNSKIEKNSIINYLTLLKNTPIKGGIESVQIYNEKLDKLKITGLLNEKQFERLENHLKENKLIFSVESLQVNEQNLVNFSIIISENE